MVVEDGRKEMGFMLKSGLVTGMFLDTRGLLEKVAIMTRSAISSPRNCGTETNFAMQSKQINDTLANEYAVLYPHAAISFQTRWSEARTDLKQIQIKKLPRIVLDIRFRFCHRFVPQREDAWGRVVLGS